MLLTPQMVLKGILTVEFLLTNFTQCLETRFRCSGGCSGLCVEDFLREDFGRQGRQGGDTAFEVVAMPVRAHVSTLEVRCPESDLTGVAGVGVGFGCGLLERGRHCWAGGGDGSHGRNM